MLPPVVAQTTDSEAECLVFRRLKEDLPDSDWIVLHSLGLTIHDRKPWAEIDFVLIGPPGVYCLEIKGGTISRTNRICTTTTRTGKTSELKESPFSQVGSASTALHKYLATVAPAAKHGVTGYGVVFPDVVFSLTGPDIEKEVLCDAGDLSAPISIFVDRLTR